MEKFKEFKLENHEMVFGGKLWTTIASWNDVPFATDIYDDESGRFLMNEL